MSAERVIEVSHVTKEYKKGWRRTVFQALSDVCISVDHGQSVGFVGHNGAGKSTTIRLILGLQQPSSGTIRLQGLNPSDPASRRGVAYVPENPILYDYLTPMELLKFAVHLHGVKLDYPEKECQRWLEKFGIADAGNKRVRDLSKGMTQRAAIAMAMVVNPELLILDEPMSGLDPLGRRAVVEILQNFREQGKTLLFSSHILSDIERLADSFVFISKGYIRAVGKAADFSSSTGQMYALVVEASEPPPLFVPDPGSAKRWKRTVGVNEVPAAVADLEPAKHYLLSVSPVASLEDAYFRYAIEKAKTDA